MRYEIQSRQDLSGAAMVVRIPEEDLDVKALNTIQADWPDFLVPFRHFSVDGEIELTYQPGSRSRLQYHFRRRTPEEYVKFWEQVLQPLLDCGDWFLKPFSFVMDSSCLYIDREEKTVSYLYIPTLRDCAGFDELKRMAVELSEKNPVTDPGMENRVLRSIMQDFQPKDFLHVLHEAERKTAAKQVQGATGPARETAEKIAPEPKPEPVAQAPAPPAEQKEKEPRQAKSANDPGDILINLGGGKEKRGKKEKKETGKGLFGGKKEKQSAPKEQKKSLFGGKGKKTGEVLLGAGAGQASSVQEQGAPSAVRKQTAAAGRTASKAADAEGPHPAWALPEEDMELTQLSEEYSATFLRLVGDQSLPQRITVDIKAGQAFTVGRFDVSVGHQQSDFEFDKKTKAVSRRHAAIERQEDGSYIIIDLASSAGTFVDGQRLTPNAAYRLSRGSRVSFGTGGADYIWEEA